MTIPIMVIVMMIHHPSSIRTRRWRKMMSVMIKWYLRRNQQHLKWMQHNAQMNVSKHGWIIHRKKDRWWRKGELMDGCMDGWTDGWTDGWMDGWMDGRMAGRTDGWMDSRTNKRTNYRSNEWTNERMNEWMNGWMTGHMDVCLKAGINKSSLDVLNKRAGITLYFMSGVLQVKCIHTGVCSPE